MGFVHLHCHTQYSLLDGAIKVNDLIENTKANGQNAVAITDHGVLYGAVEFHDKAYAAGLKPIIGCEVYVAPREMELKKPVVGEPNYYHLILLAKDYEGYQNLVELVSLSNKKGFYHKPRVDKRILKEFNRGLIAMSACLQGEIPYWLLRGNEDKALKALEFYRSTFDGRFYVELQENKLADQDRVNPLLVDVARRFDMPLVATNDCHYLKAEDAKAHEALMCIQTQKTLLEKDHMEFETDQLYLKSPEQMLKDFSWLPDAVTMTGAIAAECEVEIPKGLYFFPNPPTREGNTLDEEIEEKAWEGLTRRLGEKATDEYKARLREELDIIKSMGFPGYFLIVADYINYAKANNVPVGPGRGSAAGSLVAYCIGITDIDPIRWNLLFERFLNPERKSMPDIDTDFCQAKRDQVIEYVKQTYGPDYVGQITTFGNMKAKAVIKDVGRVMGMSYSDVDKIAKLIPNDLKMTLDKALVEEPKLKQLIDAEPQVAKLWEIATALEGLSRHASVHAGGVVISDDKPLTAHVPVYVDKKDMLISQYDKDCVERVGLIKFDMLGLKTLTVIHTALDILKVKGLELDIDRIPLDDEQTFRLIGEGDTSSVFQLESDGMKQMLRSLRPDKFEDIIAAVALYRPGPMDLIPSYVSRRHGRELVEYPHPMLESILAETYGIIIYQEQVMQIAQVMGGYSLGKADLLRRAMGKKKKEVMDAQRAVFMEGAMQRAVSRETATEVFDLMEKFASYGFNKSHAAAYALVSFQTAYLKAHHFKEFMAANLTLDLNNTDKVVRHIAECKARGVRILSPDINESRWEFVTTEAGIRFGLGGIKSVGKGAVDLILEERDQHGRFETLQAFVQRINLSKVNKRVIEALIKSGAFDSLHKNRRAMLEALDEMIEQAQRIIKQKQSAQETLFSLDDFSDSSPAVIELPQLNDWPENEKLRMEKEGMGFYISGHPLNRYVNLLERFATATTLDLAGRAGGVIVAGMLNGLNVMRTKRGDMMARAVLEDLHGSVPVIFFPKCYNEYQGAISEEEPVVIKAQISANSGDSDGDEDADTVRQVELFVDEVYPIESAEVTLARKMIVRIPQNMKNTDIAAIKEAVRFYRGNCVLSFEIKTEKAVVALEAGSDFMVNPCRELVERVAAIIGPDGVDVQ